MWDDWGHGYGHGMSDGFDFGWLWAILLIVLLAGLVYVAVRLATRDRTLGQGGDGQAAGSMPPATQPAPPTSSARQILEDRLARGEIDAAEFRERVTALEEA